jgi:sec-independent protein translocase protein TatB
VFGLSIEKLVVIAVIAAFIIGPQRLPAYAAKLARFVTMLRGLADTAKDRVSKEMGPDFDDVDWKKLDPRQYDPRRIIRTALMDEVKPVTIPARVPVENDPLLKPSEIAALQEAADARAEAAGASGAAASTPASASASASGAVEQH